MLVPDILWYEKSILDCGLWARLDCEMKGLEQLLRMVFSSFCGQKIFFFENICFIKIWVYNIKVGNKHLFYHLWQLGAEILTYFDGHLAFWLKKISKCGRGDRQNPTASGLAFFKARQTKTGTCVVSAFLVSVTTCGSSKVIYTKYSKHWPYTVAHIIDCVCRKC